MLVKVMNLSKEKLSLVLANEVERIKASYPSCDISFALVEIIRGLDFQTFILNHNLSNPDNQKLIERYKFGWSLAYSIFFEKLNPTDDIPLFTFGKENREWVDSVIQHSASIQLCEQFLLFEKAGLVELNMESEETFIFSHLLENPGLEYYDRASINYYFSIVNKVLEKKNKQVIKKLPEIRKRLKSIVHNVHDKFIAYKATEEVDLFYREFGYLYLMTTQIVDDFKHDDTFGGIKYGEYLDAIELCMKATIMHRDCCMALCKKTNFKVNLRDVLTYLFPAERLISNVANHLGWSKEKVFTVLSTLSINKENYIFHLSYPDSPCAPYFQISENIWMRSIYGCLEMPVFFLNRELKRRFKYDYDNAVNNRELRFRNELYSLFPQERIVSVHSNVNIIIKGKVLTDIDAVLYDRERKVLGLFQLKWQDSYSSSMRERYSRISNLIPKSVEWIDKVQKWIMNSEPKKILKTCKLNYDEIEDIHLFVISRHHMNFTSQTLDKRAIWASWFQLIEASAKVKDQSNSNPIVELAVKLKFFSPEVRNSREEKIDLEDNEFNFSKYKVKINSKRQK